MPPNDSQQRSGVRAFHVRGGRGILRERGASVLRTAALLTAVVLSPATVLSVVPLHNRWQSVSAGAWAAPCTDAAHHQFDFFAGDWDTYDLGDTVHVTARNRVTPMVGGCALREVYEQRDGLVGESFSTYDAARGVWHQSWVTNRGSLLLMDGHLEHGRMVLTGADRPAHGAASTLRVVWTPIAPAVRETCERSTDGGHTWTPVFDIIFRPHRPSAGR